MADLPKSSEVPISDFASTDAAEENVQDAGQNEFPSATQGFEVTLLVPTQSFFSPSGASGNGKPASKYLELPIPIQLSDAVHELRQMIVESPEGFWLGSFGLVPLAAQEIPGKAGEELTDGQEETWGPWEQLEAPINDPTAPIIDPKIWRLTGEGVLGEFSDLTAVFGGDFKGKKRGLKVVPCSYAPLAMSLHLLRVRDTLYSSLPNLGTPGSYDPTSLAIGAGSTVFTSVRGEIPENASTSSLEEEDLKGNKVKNGTEPKTQPESESIHPFTDFKLEDLNFWAFLDNLKLAPSSVLASPCVRAFGVSPWSPPPHSRRMRGDIIYLTLTTLETETYHITGASSGFWISKSTGTHFDPLPRSPAPHGLKSKPYHSLFELMCALSPGFVAGLLKIIDTQNPSKSATDIFASLTISHAVPAAPWMVPAPIHTADPFRTQLAYLLTTTTNAELLPPARDWNDELGQFRDLPHRTTAEKLLRERLLHRVQADYVSAATKGALSIARGDVPPLNPNEPEEAHTFIHNNMLYTRADDAVKAFEHVGGNEASRLAASKDLAGVSILDRLDVKHLHTMATVVVDYCGERWIVQSLIPGLFKTKDQEEENATTVNKQVEVYPEGDEGAIRALENAKAQDEPFPSQETPNKDDYPPYGSFRIVYGSANPELPNELVRSSAYFHKIAKEVAREMRFEEHIVYNEKRDEIKLWTSTDMHGIAAPDGRSYFIDCYRMHCVDVEFLENDIEGQIFNSFSAQEVNGFESKSKYPHRLVLLRAELIEAYRDSKLQKWIEDRVQEARDKIARDASEEEAAEKKSVAKEIKGAIESSVNGENEVEDLPAPKPSSKHPASVINAADYHLSFNPDAFVERKTAVAGGPAALIYDPEAESTKNVRYASKYLREVCVPTFVKEIVVNFLVLNDGRFLTKLMHRKGINMRYLGMLAHFAKLENDKQDTSRKPEVQLALKNLILTLQTEMIVRASKHIINRLLRSANRYDHASIIAHYFNCVLGANAKHSPVAELDDIPEGVTASRTWSEMTPASVQQQILKEVEARYRYKLPLSCFSTIAPSKLMREIALRAGVQFLLRKYDFSQVAQAKASATTNGHHVTDDEKTSESTGEIPPGQKKKKRKGSVKVASATADASSDHKGVFRPSDVLNIMPLVKSTNQTSSLVDEAFSAGQRALNEGVIDQGQDYAQEALQFAEQIYGSVHAEAAIKYHTLGILYHGLHQTVMRKVAMHDAAEEALANMDVKDRPEAIKRFEELLLSHPETAKQEADGYLQQAVRMVRQSIIIAERTLGLDSPETIQQYSDLGLLEQSVGNVTVGLRLTKHALYLWTAAYGPNHPTTLNLLTNAAAMIQGQYGMSESIPLLHECAKLAAIIYGEKSAAYGAAQHSLAQAFAYGADLPASLKHSKEALRVLEEVLGKDAKETTDAAAFVRAVEEATDREGQEKKAKEDRLRKKFPRIMDQKDTRTRLGMNGALGGVVEKGKGPTAEVPAITLKTHGEKADLSVEELVKYIQGVSPSSNGKSNRKRKTSPPIAST